MLINYKSCAVYQANIPNYIFTVNPTPADAVVTLTAPGYTQVGNSIEVAQGTTVSCTVSRAGLTTYTNTYIVNSTTTENITLTYPVGTILFESNIPGAYSYTYNPLVPVTSCTLMVAGAGGGPAHGLIDAQNRDPAGNGELLTTTQALQMGDILSGILGQGGLGTDSYSIGNPNYGSGYSNGTSGSLVGSGMYRRQGGGGAGSSSLAINNVLVLEASGGAGMSNATAIGGTGGGPNGGTSGPTTSTAGNGEGAIAGYFIEQGGITTGIAGGNGYVKIIVEVP